MEKPLEKEDINLLKKDIYLGIFFAVLLFTFFAVVFFLALKGHVNIDPYSVLLLGFVFSLFVFWIVASVSLKDIKSGKKIILEKPLEIHEDERKIKKSKVISVVDAWGFKRKKSKNNFMIHVDNATFEVSKQEVEEAEKKGKVKLHYSKYGNKLLKIEV